ncbi:MAG TPA: DUF1992 domain-containing protein [Planctomycetaceae bacterium]|jgi:hypothetical protein|nr:DUF1992 domain-containing protein [Planctomycetaceae bacterium]
MSQPKPKPSIEKFESFAERKIREAQAQGQFDALPGFGKPIPSLDEPDDENWWIKNKLRREGLVLLPPILEARRDIEKTLEAIRSMPSEHRVRVALKALNERIRAAHFSVAEGPADGVRPVDIEAVVTSWRKSQAD